MALSPNYGWSEPDNSSLVKNGAADIRTLGDAIDTSVWNIGFGQAGKNAIINGNFAINQRGFTSNTATGAYNFDRFLSENSGGTATTTPQTFTVGAAPVAGYEAKNFVRVVTSGQSATSDYTQYVQRIEDVRTFAGNTVTMSFWAKAGTGTPSIAGEIRQSFGSGGSAGVFTPAGKVAITTSWARYSLTVAVPSISGKTIGTANDSFIALDLWLSAGTDFNTRASSLGVQNATIDIWGMQLEYGSKMTPFDLAGGGSPQAELAMCQRYYYRQTAFSAFGPMLQGFETGSTSANGYFNLPVTLRSTPSAVDYSTLFVNDQGGNITITGITIGNSSQNLVNLSISAASGMVAGRPFQLLANNSTSAFLGVSAEL